MRKSSTILLETGSFVPEHFKMECWSDVEPFFTDLQERTLCSVNDLEQWILDKSQLDSAISEAFAWMYIRITTNSDDQEALETYQHCVKNISPKVSSMENKLNEKLVNTPFLTQLDADKFGVHLRQVRNSVDLFREENLALNTEVQLKSKEYGRIFSQMTIGMDGRQMTLQKANTMLEEKDRDRRQQVYHKIYQRILQDTDQLEKLFDELLVRRHQIAANAGFDNYRDYAFRSLARFDYTAQDCADFHTSIAEEVLPILDDIFQVRKDALQFERLRPWDLNIDAQGKAPLKPFKDSKDLLEKGISTISHINPEFGEVLRIMDKMGQLDLESRPGKRPGAYNMPLFTTGVPFLFMNATGSLNDLRTLMHESGHAIHAYLTRDLNVSTSKRFPSEVSELAAMTMELLTLEHWGDFFDNKEELKRAKINQLEMVLKVLPWIATVDKFQHWLYTHPGHSRAQRQQQWLTILQEFTSNVIDYTGLDSYMEHLWHKQLHIFEVPFYYVEYGFAQLGAIAIWRAYKKDPERAIRQYTDALKLGYSRPIGEIYQTAGIQFDFGREYVSQLGAFVRAELDELINS